MRVEKTHICGVLISTECSCGGGCFLGSRTSCWACCRCPGPNLTSHLWREEPCWKPSLTLPSFNTEVKLQIAIYYARSEHRGGKEKNYCDSLEEQPAVLLNVEILCSDGYNENKKQLISHIRQLCQHKGQCFMCSATTWESTASQVLSSSLKHIRIHDVLLKETAD